MDFSDIFCRSETPPVSVEGCSAFLRNTYSMTAPSQEPDGHNRTFAELQIDELVKLVKSPERIKTCISNDFAFHSAGWQSWSFGGEVDCGAVQKQYVPIIPQWKQYIAFPGTQHVHGRRLLSGKFIIYMRWGTTYIVVASTGNTGPEYAAAVPCAAADFIEFSRGKVLPPVQFFVDRAARTITCTVYSDGKKWHKGERIAELTMFAAKDYFALKAGIAALFGGVTSQKMQQLDFINCAKDGNPRKLYTAGWESWYNHYERINWPLISEDLESLAKTPNLVNIRCIQKQKPVVFQVDDGWEQALGDWHADTGRFPDGMTALAAAIEQKGYVPGLWIAPFIIDWRSRTAQEHPDWILRDKKGRPVEAGFHLIWGAPFGSPRRPYSYFCLDLSRDDVLEHLKGVMSRAIHEWGFRYLKLDFLFAGMLDGAFANGGSAYQWYDRALKTITAARQTASGKPVAYLGCGLPFEASYNLLPLSRIGPDTREAWDTNYLRRARFEARAGAFANLQSTLGHAFWDKSVYVNDPDVVFMRYENISLSDTEKELIALVNFMFSSQLMLSDDPVKFDAESEGFFTNHIDNLYKILTGTEWAVQNRTADTYYIYSKCTRFVGLINLSNKAVAISHGEAKSDIPFADGLVSDKFEPLVLHGEKTRTGYLLEKHSINIFETQKQ